MMINRLDWCTDIILMLGWLGHKKTTVMVPNGSKIFCQGPVQSIVGKVCVGYRWLAWFTGDTLVPLAADHLDNATSIAKWSYTARMPHQYELLTVLSATYSCPSLDANWLELFVRISFLSLPLYHHFTSQVSSHKATVVCPVWDPIPKANMESKPSKRMTPKKSPLWMSDSFSTNSSFGGARFLRQRWWRMGSVSGIVEKFWFWIWPPFSAFHSDINAWVFSIWGNYSIS